MVTYELRLQFESAHGMGLALGPVLAPLKDPSIPGSGEVFVEHVVVEDGERRSLTEDEKKALQDALFQVLLFEIQNSVSSDIPLGTG